MKFISRVSLFCAIGILGAVLGIYGNKTYEKLFYPNRLTQQQLIQKKQSGQEQTIEKKIHSRESADGVPADTQAEAVVSCDTVFLIEEYDKNTKITATHKEKMPGKYMGMNREAFVDAMMSYEMSPPLEEQKRGLLSVEVLIFSEERVLLRKSYEMIEAREDEQFYLVAEDHYITVYMEDMQNVYLYTDIHLEDLPSGLQEEIIQRKLITGESNLFHFLESYSS